MNNGGDSSDTLVIKPQKPEEDKAILLVTEFQNLTDLDFKNFNYFSFEQDVSDMIPEEFEWWYAERFEPWLFKIDNNYLDLDFDDHYYRFNSQDEKKIFLLKIVNFVMFLLPYQILREIFRNYEIDESSSLNSFIEDDSNLIQLRSDIINGLDHNMTQFDSFIKTLLHFEKISKKNLVEENIELLDEHVKKQNFFLEIFKGIIQETDMHKMKDLITRMIETDASNIL
jgi:hypothetical protein